MSNYPTFSYQNSAALGASPVGQIVVLYDAIIRDFMEAVLALKAGRIEVRVNKLNHALTIIGHLQCVLDYERGGDAAKYFARFYDLTRGMVVDANARADSAAIAQLIDLYGGVRQAWHEAEQNLAESSATSDANESSRGAPRSAPSMDQYEEMDTVQSHWST